MKPELLDLKFIEAEGGGIVKVLDLNSSHYTGFGEFYLSKISHGTFRGWKKHLEMTSLLFVVQGDAEFHFFEEDHACYTLILKNVADSQLALKILPGQSYGFRSMGTDGATIANFANTPHRAGEAVRPMLDSHECGWTA